MTTGPRRGVALVASGIGQPLVQAFVGEGAEVSGARPAGDHGPIFRQAMDFGVTVRDTADVCVYGASTASPDRRTVQRPRSG
jgi:hypothetical protein